MESASARLEPVSIALDRCVPEHPPALGTVHVKDHLAPVRRVGLEPIVLLRVARWYQIARDMAIVSRASASVRKDGRVIFVRWRLLALVIAATEVSAFVESAIVAVDMAVLPARERSALPIALVTEFVFVRKNIHQERP